MKRLTIAATAIAVALTPAVAGAHDGTESRSLSELVWHYATEPDHIALAAVISGVVVGVVYRRRRASAAK